MKLDIASISNKGGRNVNEDACHYFSIANIACCVLSDGLGGHHGGEVASKLVIEGVVEGLKEAPECNDQVIRFLLNKADKAIVTVQRQNEALSQMRATVVVLIIDANEKVAIWGHVGDSRLYCFRNRQIIKQTRDHSVSQSMVDAGYIEPSDLRSSPTRNQLYAALGNGDYGKYDIPSATLPIMNGDVFLMCSDGLWEYIEENEMESTLNLSRTAAEWLDFLEKLVLARGHPRQDNYSAVAIICKE